MKSIGAFYKLELKNSKRTKIAKGSYSLIFQTKKILNSPFSTKNSYRKETLKIVSLERTIFSKWDQS